MTRERQPKLIYWRSAAGNSHLSQQVPHRQALLRMRNAHTGAKPLASFHSHPRGRDECTGFTYSDGNAGRKLIRAVGGVDDVRHWRALSTTFGYYY